MSDNTSLESLDKRVVALENSATAKDNIKVQQAMLKASVAILVIVAYVVLAATEIDIPDAFNEIVLAIATMYLLGDAGFQIAASRVRNNK